MKKPLRNQKILQGRNKKITGKPLGMNHTSTQKKPSQWIFGTHAVQAALLNPKRNCTKLLVTERQLSRLNKFLKQNPTIKSKTLDLQVVEKNVLEQCLPDGVVHQGITANFSRLPSHNLTNFVKALEQDCPALLVLIDQGSDPRNVGAIMRSAAALGAKGIILPRHNSPDLAGSLAKAASGGLETLPVFQVNNLARTLEDIKNHGFWVVGLEGSAKEVIETFQWPLRSVLILGSEGKGLRKLTQNKCDFSIRIPMCPNIQSLNLSNAAAIAIYDFQAKSSQHSKT